MNVSRFNVRPNQQKGALRERAARLVHAYGRHIGSGMNCRLRQPVIEIKMRTVRFVGQYEHIMLMRHFNYFLQIGAYAVIRRIIDQNGLCIGIFPYRFFYIFDRHTERYAELFIHLRIYIYRHSAAKYHGIYGASVHIARQNDFIAALAGRQNHSLDCRRRAADHEKSMLSAESFRCQLLRLFYHGYGMTQIVKRFH